MNPLKGNENEIKQGRCETEQTQGLDKDVADCSKGYPRDFPGQTSMSMPSKHGKTINCSAACSVLRLLCIWNDYFLARARAGGKRTPKLFSKLCGSQPSWESIAAGSREMRRNAKTEVSLMKIARNIVKIEYEKKKTVIYPSISACRR